jgi:PiT family inorganic phosphate transporter
VLVVAVVGIALTFALTNGFHDSANAIAALVATKAARPATALALAGACHLLGPLLLGTAVADTVGGVVHPARSKSIAVVGAALTAAIAWGLLTWWKGLPASSSHALVGGLVGASAMASGWGSVHWGGWSGAHVSGVAGVLAALAISPVLGLAGGTLLVQLLRRALRKATRRVARPLRRAEWATASLLALSHGANDAAKTMGVITLVLVAHGDRSSFSVRLWVKVATAAAMGGWRIVRTVGRGIYRLGPLEGLASQSCSAGVILSAAVIGAPVSTTHVVAASVMGVGLGERRRHVRWRVAREIGSAWILTLPVCGALGAVLVPLWRWWS